MKTAIGPNPVADEPSAQACRKAVYCIGYARSVKMRYQLRSHWCTAAQCRGGSCTVQRPLPPYCLISDSRGPPSYPAWPRGAPPFPAACDGGKKDRSAPSPAAPSPAAGAASPAPSPRAPLYAVLPPPAPLPPPSAAAPSGATPSAGRAVAAGSAAVPGAGVEARRRCGVPAQMWAGVSPVPVQMWSPGADVARTCRADVAGIPSP